MAQIPLVKVQYWKRWKCMVLEKGCLMNIKADGVSISKIELKNLLNVYAKHLKELCSWVDEHHLEELNFFSTIDNDQATKKMIFSLNLFEVQYGAEAAELLVRQAFIKSGSSISLNYFFEYWSRSKRF
jgi:hypothetical protein